jgi:hypothetical protein
MHWGVDESTEWVDEMIYFLGIWFLYILEAFDAAPDLPASIPSSVLDEFVVGEHLTLIADWRSTHHLALGYCCGGQTELGRQAFGSFTIWDEFFTLSQLPRGQSALLSHVHGFCQRNDHGDGKDDILRPELDPSSPERSTVMAMLHEQAR